MNKPLALAVAAVVAAAIAGFLYYDNAAPEPSPSASVSPTISGSPRACTLEAKLCPDGSAVGRTGPNCEFAPCPTPMPSNPPPYRY